MDATEILSGAHDILSSRGWTQGSLGRTSAQSQCSADHPAATSFCVIGAAYHYVSTNGGWCPDNSSAYEDAIGAMARVVKGHVPIWNDSPKRTKAEVLKMLRQSKTLAEVEESPKSKQEDHLS